MDSAGAPTSGPLSSVEGGISVTEGAGHCVGSLREEIGKRRVQAR